MTIRRAARRSLWCRGGVGLSVVVALAGCGDGASPAEPDDGAEQGKPGDEAPREAGAPVDAGSTADGGGHADARDAGDRGHVDAGDAGDAGDDDALHHVCPTAPLTRQTMSNISYHSTMTAKTRVTNVDLTKFENIWGRASFVSAGPVSEIVPWPGRSGTTPIIDRLKPNHYIAARFHVPADFSRTASGLFYNFENFPSTATLAISPRCGDFSPADPSCVRTATTGGGLGGWQLPDANEASCVLEPGKDYYLNFKAEPFPGSPTCTAAGCRVAVLPLHAEP